MLNLDLQDFFGTINFGRVRGFFIKNNNFALRPEIATILAQIACHQNALPQGSPCSPVISNLIGHVLDIRLSKLAFEHGCTYSRYADDLTFSTNEPQFPPSIAKATIREPHIWKLGKPLQEIVVRSGFAINPAKTRMQYYTSRQDVTGLVVNRKVNIRREYRHRVRAMCHRLFTTGKFQLIETIPHPNAAEVLVPTQKEGTLAQLHGILGHINSVDLHNARIEKKSSGVPKTTSLSMNSKENLYRRFLMFKEFYVAPAPVIVCEGKTDSVYIRHAIKSLAATFPSLATVTAGKPTTLNVRIPTYPLTPTGRILNLKGGTSLLAKFIPNYAEEMKRFKAPGKQNPVIILVDNDSGAKPVYNAIREITGSKPTGKEPFVYIVGNLYMVVTPLAAGQNQSMIEDAFGTLPRTLNLNGKSFNPDEDTFDAALHYDKHIFSQYVRDHANKSDFTGFEELLNRIMAVIAAHKLAAVPNPQAQMIPSP